MKLADFIVKDAIVPELQATDRDGVIRELVTSLAAAKAIAASDVDVIVKAIVDREKTGSTGFGKGVAVPHVKHPAVKKRMGAVGRSTVGVDFAALDQSPVYSVIMLLSPPNSPDGHLQAMEKDFQKPAGGHVPAVPAAIGYASEDCGPDRRGRPGRRGSVTEGPSGGNGQAAGKPANRIQSGMACRARSWIDNSRLSTNSDSTPGRRCSSSM